MPLHGDLSPAEQDRAVGKADRRKIILATNVAESSVTIEGVVAVVDGGLARVARQAPWSGLSVLRVEKTSRASAAQRAGRAGRTCPGRCLRLYTKSDHDTRPEHDLPEIRRVDLAQTLLELRAANANDLDWLEPPPADALRSAEDLLARLGAVDTSGSVTPLGHRMLRFPLHPRQARLLLEAEARGVADDGAVLAALVAERDIRSTARASFGSAGRGRDIPTEDSDLIAMLDRFREAEGSNFSASALRAIGLDAGATFAVDRAQKQLVRMCRAPAVLTRGSATMKLDDILRLCVLAGYPDRVAKRKKQGSRDLALAGGGQAELSFDSAVRDAEWLVAVDAESAAGAPPQRGYPQGQGHARVRVASAIEPDWLIELFIDAVREIDEVTWNPSAERVEAKSRMLYEGLLLEESTKGRAPEAEITRVLGAAALEKGARAFAPEGTLDRWLLRARFAAQVDASIAAPTDDEVKAALLALCSGKRSFAELRQASLLETLKARVGPAYAARIEHLAPEKLTLASGRQTAIAYEEGKPPFIESFLQDFFGTTETPRVGGGKTPLVVHLLAPNKRAVQVTTDLKGFWERHYPSVRKEMARKYPRHNWPETPETAIARVRR